MSGRGRGRGSTLPAWMTHGDQPEGRDRRDIHRDDRRPPDHDRRDAPRYDRRPGDFDRDAFAEGDNTRPMGRGRGGASGSMGREGLGYAPPLNRDEWERSSDRLRDVNFVRGGDRDDDLPPAGRGRGRGRGISNKPAWMDSSSGPTGLSPVNTEVEDKKDDTMELLLAQARQVQQEQLNKKKINLVKEEVKREEKEDIKKKEEERRQREHEAELEKQRQIEEQKKAAEEELKRIELEREKEEQRQLLALVGDDMELDSKKRQVDDDEDEELFVFETEEEREERMARQRREERRKKLKVMENPSNDIADQVDKPRNPAGIIASEMEDIVPTTNPVKEMIQTEDNTAADNDSDDDSFDIFASDNPTPIPQAKTNGNVHKNAAMSRSNIAQECDDAEGYYKANIGEIITVPKQRGEDADELDDNNKYARFRVLGIIGKGVFSTVIKVVEENDSNQTPGREVAMKVIRNNEVMAKAAAKEMRILRMLCRPRDKKKKDEPIDNGDEEDPDEKERRERENHNIVRLLEVDPEFMAKDSSSYAIPPPEFRSHCIFLFEFLPYNLREVLSKFGKNVGITLTAVRSYARQLLCALGHLERHRIVHADLKPDNILVSANFSTVKLADFGSAFFETDHDNDPTPYLVSRFYRPPEVILGLEYDRMVDLWSTSVTLAELFTGSVLFPGSSNNDILMKFMDTLGPFSHKMVRRHAASYTKMGLIPHFEVGITGGTYRYCKHDVDRVTGQPVVRMTTVLSAKTDARLPQVLLRASKVGNGSASERVEVLKFADFLSRCLALDPTRRLTVRDALKHEFFMKKKKKKDTNKDS